MNNRPVHRIDVTHRWQEREKAEPLGDTENVIVLKCLDCGQSRRLLDFDAYDESNERDSTEGEILEKIVETGRKLSESIEKYLSSVVGGTKYSSVHDLLCDIEKRFYIDAKEIPFQHLEIWLNQGNRRFKQKALLLYAQGPVCNRCDEIFHPEDLTRDHIDGNRHNGRVNNLQLLCKMCHRVKNREGNLQSERDVSPFHYEGEQCVHKISCINYRRIPRVPHNEP